MRYLVFSVLLSILFFSCGSNKSSVQAPMEKTKAISFTLENKSSESIPLLIPTVMNPNLSPNSMSGVSLRIGQEVFFKVKGRKYLLLRVDDSIKKGDVLDVAALLLERKRTLELI